MITLSGVREKITLLKRKKILQGNELFMFDSSLSNKRFEKIKQEQQKLLQNSKKFY